ncbi:MAG TPA: AI-2E family transporter [Phenylobacterium sp.]|jgi:AI-2 transport protein TqsA|uniref:AI-2E family transporter n=1 Tax=Phenylobacterium sp. TaxID=1871053 RepID=UPI002CEFC790|nr:AI-2E family transporter [Phenylobacterium sp.]HXA39035.1 AI-2E family transporter [Phenylobacterium sp.]
MAKPAIPLRALQASNVVMAVILVGIALWLLRRILEPFALAVFLLIMIDSLARALRARIRGFPPAAALPSAIAAIIVILGLAVWLTVDNAADFASRSAGYTARINALLVGAAERLGMAATPTVSGLIRELNPVRYAGVFASGLSHFAEGAVFVLIYLGFLLASRQGFAAKAQAFFATEAERDEGDRIFDRIRRGVESYIWVQTVVGVMITGASAALMLVTGLTHIPFWCAIIFLANYVPAVGAAIGVLFPAAFGLVEFTTVWPAIGLVVGLEAIHFAVSHVVQPRMQGQSLNLDPIVVLLSLAFWGLVWGVVGAFLSTPLAVMAMAILAEFQGSRPIAVLLSRDGKPYGDVDARR